MSYRKKLIEVALPLEAINDASAREKDNPFWKDHPRRIHVWWARRPHVTCRAVIFASLVDDPENPHAPKEFVAACGRLPKGRNSIEIDTPRQRLFDFIEKLVDWKNTHDREVLMTASRLIRLSNDALPSIMDPFAGGASIPLEALRLGLNTFSNDLNPVAVLINKALLEIPLLFKDNYPVNSDSRASQSMQVWKGYQGIADDLRHYSTIIHQETYNKIGGLYPKGPNNEKIVAWIWARTVKRHGSFWANN